jgi:chromosome segregation ATPase
MSQSDPVRDQGLALSQTTHAKSLLNLEGELIDHPNADQLPNTLEAAHALLQHQQAIIDRLSQQLRNAQVRLVEQEQERLEVAHSRQEASRQLEQVQATCQDLRVRLKRQQQQALQFKAALEQCVDSCSVQKQSEPVEDETFAKAALRAVLESTAQSASQERPIQPWSVHAMQAAEVTRVYAQTPHKLTALSGSPAQVSQASPRSLRRPPSDFAHIDLPTFPRY